jgi:class 3 adenylate cyclase/tetratricopeptide (TPR) repeat protein
VSDLAGWLGQRGLEKYASVFAENDVDLDVLKALSEEDLRELGLPLGARKRILQAIADADRPVAAPGRYVEAEPRASPERRQITVLFSDVVGSTALSERVDVEDLRALILEYQQACASGVAQYGGHIAQYLGDGVLAYFGYPHAHEDDAVRAVRAGLAMIERMKDVNRRLMAEQDLALDIRVGVHTGLVVAGEMGAGATRERLAVGETPNVAARVQGLADPGTVVVSEATWLLVEGFFTAQPLGCQALKGVSRPISTYRILGSTGLTNPFEARLSRSLTPLVSREAELGVLAKRWQQATEAEGQVVIVQGEAGIGKSRLVRTFGDRLAEDDHVLIALHCSAQHESSPLYPAIEHLIRTLELGSGNNRVQQQARLRALMDQHGVVPDAFSPVAALLGIEDQEASSASLHTPEQLRHLTFDAFIRMIVPPSRERPLLLIVEDVHWVDPSTQDLIRNMVDAIHDQRVMMVLTARPEYRAPWALGTHVTALTVGRLSRRETEAMIRQVAGDTFPSQVLVQLLSRSDGIPLFVEELTKSVMEAKSGATGHLNTVPATLRDALTARLDRLAPVRELIQVAALLGRVFDAEVVREVTGLEQNRFDRALIDLAEAGLVYRWLRQDRLACEFKHALIQEAALSTLIRQQRALLHGRIAAALSRMRADVVQHQPEVVARHFEQAGDDRSALSLWRAAGTLAAQRSASAEAANHLRQAVACLQRLGAQAVPAEEQTAIYLALATALMQAEGYRASGLAAAAEAAEQAATASDSVSLRCSATVQMAAVLIGVGRNSACVTAVDRLLGSAADQLSPGMHASLLIARSIAYYHRGEFIEAERGFQSASDVLSMSIPPDGERLGGADIVVAAASYASLTLQTVGRLETAYAASLAAADRARQLDDPFTLAWALFTRSRAYAGLGEWEAALADAEETVAIARRYGFSAFAARGLEFRGRARAALGNLSAGIADCREALMLWGKSGVVHTTPYIAADLADLLEQAGRSGEARSVLDEIDALVAGTDEAAVLAECQRVRGLIALEERDVPEAIDWLQKAIATSRRQAARLYELRATTAWAEVAMRHGETTDARRALANVYGWFTEGQRAPDLQRAKAVLDRIDAGKV